MATASSFVTTAAITHRVTAENIDQLGLDLSLKTPILCFRGLVGVWNGRGRFREKCSFSRSRSPTRDLGNQFLLYFNLNDVGYIDLMVNHSENFVDPYTGPRSNTIEGLCSQVERRR